MQAHKLTVTAFSLGAALALVTLAKAADLPQSGTIKIHGAHKGTVQAVQVGEKHSMGSGSNWGVTYNESGSGGRLRFRRCRRGGQNLRRVFCERGRRWPPRQWAHNRRDW
jgi:hypothetical protein